MSGYCIYTIFNKINGKIYVGQSNDHKERWKKHIGIALGNIKEHAYPVHKAMIKYGIKNFTFTVILWLDSRESCNLAEKYWISYFRSNEREFGYNLTEGGGGTCGFSHSEEAIQKMREKATGRKHKPETIELYKKRRHSEETKKHLSEIQKGKMPVNIEQLKVINIGIIRSEENRKNISEGLKKWAKDNPDKVLKGEKHGMYGKNHSDETILRLSGENNKLAKIKEREVIEIREKFATGKYTHQQLADEYGICRKQAGRIINCIDWKHVPGNPPQNIKKRTHKYDKISRENILIIIELYKTGEYSQRKLAALYNVSQKQIYCIVNGKINPEDYK